MCARRCRSAGRSKKEAAWPHDLSLLTRVHAPRVDTPRGETRGIQMQMRPFREHRGGSQLCCFPSIFVLSRRWSGLSSPLCLFHSFGLLSRFFALRFSRMLDGRLPRAFLHLLRYPLAAGIRAVARKCSSRLLCRRKFAGKAPSRVTVMLAAWCVSPPLS